MSDKEIVTCWACNEAVSKTADICPNCDMPLKESSEDIDSLLDNLSEESSATYESETAEIDTKNIPEFIEEMPEIPEFEFEESEMPEIPDFDIEPAIPEFNEYLPDIPDFATETMDLQELDQDGDYDLSDATVADPVEEVIDKISEQKDIPEPYKIDVKIIEEGLSDIPTFDDEQFIIEDEKEAKVHEMLEIITLSSLTSKQKLRIFIPQLTYWSFVFVIISFASLTVTNSNFSLESFNPDYYEIGAELFLFGWLSFIPMGWFYRYKLNQYGVKDSIVYGFLYIILQVVYLGIVTIIFFLVVNPEAQLASLTDTDTAVTTIMSTYIYFSFLGFLISGFTLGFFLFFVGYKFYFNQIYRLTPASKLSN